MRLILFDIDGTLVLSGGAGSRALKQAIHQAYGVPDSLDGVRVHGKTDRQIVREVLSHYGAEHLFTEETIAPLFANYISLLREELSSGENFEVLPGARELVRTLNRTTGIILGLATGNVEEGARMKLERAGLNAFFSFGGFGSDAENRTELIRIAIHRAGEIESLDPGAVYMIGDTPRDIVHGKEAGAHTIAVASGSYSAEALEGYKPDLVADSLDPIQPIVEFLGVNS